MGKLKQDDTKKQEADFERQIHWIVPIIFSGIFAAG